MIEILHGLELGPWVLRRIPTIKQFGPHVCIGVGDGEKIIAAAIYHDYDGYNMGTSFATDTPRAITRRVIREMLGYPFLVAGVARLTNLVEATNAASIRLTEGLGFKREGLLRRGCRTGNDMIVYGMLPEDCEQWIGKIGVRHALAA